MNSDMRGQEYLNVFLVSFSGTFSLLLFRDNNLISMTSYRGSI